MSRELYFMDFSSLHIGPLNSVPSYFDADWADDPTYYHSSTGYYFLFGTSLLSWRNKKQFLHNLTLRLSTALLLMLPLKFCGYAGF
jgi:uncharacterized membrane protein